MTIEKEMFCLCGNPAIMIKTSQCKKCYQKNWYQKSKDKIMEKANAIALAKKLTPLDPLEELCIRCGNRFPYADIKLCESCYKKTNYQKHKDKILEKARTPEGRFSRAKVRAKEKDMLFTLPKELYLSLIEMPCDYCNGYFPPTVAGIGLDRLDNTKGYEPGNVVSACGTCNQLRMNVFTPEETKLMVRAVIADRKGRAL